MRVILVRHGESVSNAAPGRVSLPPEEGDLLTDRGLEEARSVGRSLRDAGVTHLISSPLRRARATAAAISEELGGLEVEINPGIYELREAPGYGGLTMEEQKLRRWSEWMVRHPDDPDRSEGGGESFNQVLGRVKAFQAELLERDRGGLALAVTHGIFIRFFLADTLLGDEFGPSHAGRLWHMRTYNCGVSVFDHGEPQHQGDPEREGWICSTWMARPWNPP
jgi:broad specificity phosphatase PhoE